MKYGFYLSSCGEKITYYYFDEEEKIPTLDSEKLLYMECN